MNELTTVWNGQEAALLWDAFRSAGTDYLLAWLVGRFDLSAGGFTFWPRSVGGIFLLISLATFFQTAKKILGLETTVYTLLVLGSSLLLPFLAKMATADVHLFSFQLIGVIFLLRFLKQPQWSWRIGFYLALAFSILVDPLSSLVFFMGYGAFLYFLHPSAKRIWSLNPWLAGLAMTALFQFTGWIHWSHPGRIFGMLDGNYGRFLLVGLLGMAPFIGFLLGGLRDLVEKWKRREELSLLLTGWLAMALIAQSTVGQAALALLIAKQLLNYSQTRYPWLAWVRTGALLVFVGLFFAISGLMMWSYYEFGGVGFRSALALGGLYWVLSFIGILGLFGFNRRYWVGGPILGGLAVSWLFWLQMNPLLETRRDWPKEVEALLRDRNLSPETSLSIVQPAGDAFPNLAVYGKRVVGDRVSIIREGEENEFDPGTIMIFQATENAATANAGTDTTEISAWTDYLRPEKVIIRWPED